MYTVFLETRREVELTCCFVDSFNAPKGTRPLTMCGKQMFNSGWEYGLKIPSPRGPGIPRVQERNRKGTCDFLSFRRGETRCK